MTSELFQILQPRINARVLALVHRHLSDEQIGLLLVKMINPYAVLSQQEEAILRGIDPKTLRGMKSRGELEDLPGQRTCVNCKHSPNLPRTGRNFPDLPPNRPRGQNRD